jgi:hypothetical protein
MIIWDPFIHVVVQSSTGGLDAGLPVFAVDLLLIADVPQFIALFLRVSRYAVREELSLALSGSFLFLFLFLRGLFADLIFFALRKLDFAGIQLAPDLFSPEETANLTLVRNCSELHLVMLACVRHARQSYQPKTASIHSVASLFVRLKFGGPQVATIIN